MSFGTTQVILLGTIDVVDADMAYNKANSDITMQAQKNNQYKSQGFHDWMKPREDKINPKRLEDKIEEREPEVFIISLNLFFFLTPIDQDLWSI